MYPAASSAAGTAPRYNTREPHSPENAHDLPCCSDRSCAHGLDSDGHPPPPAAPSSSPLTVHEWGTFTSVAGEDGRAQEWLPRQAPGELPCFVERLPLNVKGYLPGTVRMETPVLYFYSPVATTVDVKVRFRNGVITEWYPRARVEPSVLELPAYRRPEFEGSISVVRAHRLPRGRRRPSLPSRVRATITRRAPPMRPRSRRRAEREVSVLPRCRAVRPADRGTGRGRRRCDRADVLGRAPRGCGVVRQ